MLEQINKYVGNTYNIKWPGGDTFLKMNIKVQAKDVKQAFGEILVLVSPIEGSGEVWVKESTLKPFIK